MYFHMTLCNKVQLKSLEEILFFQKLLLFDEFLKSKFAVKPIFYNNHKIYAEKFAFKLKKIVHMCLILLLVKQISQVVCSMYLHIIDLFAILNNVFFI